MCGGFADVIDLNLIRTFSEAELSELLSGTAEVDLADLRAHATYTFGYAHVVDRAEPPFVVPLTLALLDLPIRYTPTSPTIQRLWEVLEEWTAGDRARFLQFVTGAPRAPPGTPHTCTIPPTGNSRASCLLC